MAQARDIEPLAGWNGNPIYDCLWPLLLAQEMPEPEDRIEGRRRMKMELARYGKLGTPGEHSGWDDVEAVEVRRQHAIVGQLLEAEGAGAGTET